MKRIATALAAACCAFFIRVPDLAAEDLTVTPITILVRSEYGSNEFPVVLIVPKNFITVSGLSYLWDPHGQRSATLLFGVTRDARTDYRRRIALDRQIGMAPRYSSFFQSEDLIYKAGERLLNTAIMYIRMRNNPQCADCMLRIEISYADSVKDFVGRALPTMVSMVNPTASGELARDVALGQGWIAPDAPAENKEAMALAEMEFDGTDIDPSAAPARSAADLQSDGAGNETPAASPSTADLESESKLVMAHTVAPNYPSADFLAMQMMMAKGNNEGAIRVADEAPPSADIFILKSKAQAANGDKDGAAKTLKQALALSKSDEQTKEIQERLAALSGSFPIIKPNPDDLIVRFDIQEVPPQPTPEPPPIFKKTPKPTSDISGTDGSKSTGSNNNVGGAQ